MKRSVVETRLVVGFPAVIRALIDILADEQAVSAEELVASAVLGMLDTFDVDRKSRPNIAIDDFVSADRIPTHRDFDPIDAAGTRPIPARYRSGPVRVELDAATARRLSDLCVDTKLSRARAIRLAVDRYLFDEITGSTVAASWRRR